MTQQVRVFDAKPSDPSSIPESRVVGRKNRLSRFSLCSPTRTMARMQPYTYTLIKIMIIF